MATQYAKDFDIKSAYKMVTGYKQPVLGYGVYQTPIKVCTDVTLEAFKQGYRHVDSARAYRNETPCADAIRQSGLKREEIFFTSKVPSKMVSYDGAKESVEASLKDTGLDYFDLYLIHSPYGGKEARCGAWKALVEAQKAGKVRSIGVSNYGVHHLDELEQYIKSSGIGGEIAVGQWELHPWLPHDDIVEWARKRNVVIQAWAPIVRGERSQEPVLKKLEKKHNKTWAQILIRWSLQKGYIPLPKSEKPDRIAENAQVFDFELDADDMKSLEFPNSYSPCSWDPTTSHD